MGYRPQPTLHRALHSPSDPEVPRVLCVLAGGRGQGPTSSMLWMIPTRLLQDHPQAPQRGFTPSTLQHQHPRARGEGLPILVPGELGGWDGTGVAVEGGGLAKDSLSVLCHLPILVFLPIEDLKGFFGACLLLEDGGHCGDRLWSAVGSRDIDPQLHPQHLPSLELRRCCFPAGLNFFPAHPFVLPQVTPEDPCSC